MAIKSGQKSTAADKRGHTSPSKPPFRRRAQAKQTSLLDHLPLATVEIDADGKILSWNNGAQPAIEYLPSRALGQPIAAVLKSLARKHQAPGLEGLAELIGASLKNGAAARCWQFKYTYEKRPRLLQADFSPLPTSSGEAASGGALVFQDVTDRCRLEEGSHVVDHLAALGQLAACMAHEVRNPLSAMRTAAQLISEEETQNSLVTRCTEIITRESQRLERLLRDFLAFARPSYYQNLPVSMEELLERSCQLLEADAAEAGIALIRKFRTKVELPTVAADQEALLQALLNIGRNALEACQAGDKVIIAANFSELDDKELLEIVVQDGGSGIPRRHLERIFEPFFTTKAAGTGLGLSIARKIIEAHGGHLHLSTRQGRGTKVSMQLPVYKSKEALA